MAADVHFKDFSLRTVPREHAYPLAETMNLTRRLLVPPLAALGLASACDSPPHDEIRHPLSENLPTGEVTLVDGSSTPSTEELRNLVTRLRNRRLLLQIGSLNGPHYTVFGSIARVTADSNQVYILDQRLNRILVYTAGGDFVTEFGRSGGGPLEFRSPEDLDVIGANTLLLTTRSGYKVFELRPTVGDVVTRAVNNIQLPGGGATISPRETCRITPDRILVRSGNASAPLLHTVDLSSGQLDGDGFGYRYMSVNELVTSHYTDGALACNDEYQIALLGWQDLPFVQAYHYDGSIAWTTLLSDFDPIPVVEFTTTDGKPAVRSELDEGGDVLLSAATIGDHFVLQIGHIKPRTEHSRRGELSGVDTYLLDASTGEGTLVGVDLPQLFGSVGNRLYAAGGEQYPVFMMFDF